MALYTPVNPGLTGAVPALVAVAASDTFQNDGFKMLHVKNAAATPVTVLIKDQNSPHPDSATQFNADVTVTVANGAEKWIGPFPTTRFNDANGLVTVQYSGTTIVAVTAEVLDTA